MSFSSSLPTWFSLSLTDVALVHEPGRESDGIRRTLAKYLLGLYFVTFVIT